MWNNMNSVLVFAILIALAINGEAYSTEHDDFDIKAAVANIDILKAMIGCFLDTHECDKVTTVFKKDIGGAVETVCETCNDKQKSHFNIFLVALKDKLPEEYKAFRNKYDPTGLHFDKLEANVAAY